MKKNKLILIILLLLVLVLIVWSITIYVPPIKGRVVDAETGKPMKGVNVRAGWVTGYAEPGGGVFRTIKIYVAKTDEKGEFVLPRTIKLKIPVIEIFQGIDLLTYEHGYVCQYFNSWEWRLGKKVKYYDVELKKINNDEEFNKNLEEIYSKLFYELPGRDIKVNDFIFMIDEFKMFLEKYPNSRFLEDTYGILASVYTGETGEREEDYESAIRWSEEFIKKYPNAPDSVINRVKENIERFKKLLKSEKSRK
jgi:hypothetical protein